MFKAEGNSVCGVIQNDTHGLWALHISTPQYWAWRYWLQDQLEYSRDIHSAWLTVWSEWPPRTAAAAQGIATTISKMRDDSGNSKPVPRRPEAWDGRVPPVPMDCRDIPIKDRRSA